MNSFFNVKSLKSYIRANKKMYLLCLLIVFVGLALGVYLVLSENMEQDVYTTTSLSLGEIIVNDYSGVEAFFECFFHLLLPLCILFVLSLNKYSMILGHCYLGFQGLLLGASIASVIVSFGVAGCLNALFLMLPINLLNFCVIISGVTIFYRRRILANSQHIKFLPSLRLFLPKILYLVLGVVIVSIVYGFIYPLLLRSVIVANY